VIDYTSNGFWPSFVDIRKDGSHTVVFRNVSDSPMRVMGDPVVGSNLPKPSFDQGLSVDRGGEFQMLLSKPGRYYYSNYMNYRHRGVIIVR
jgi:plastocyanin